MDFYHSLVALVHATIVYAKLLFLLDIVRLRSRFFCGYATVPQKIRASRII